MSFDDELPLRNVRNEFPGAEIYLEPGGGQWRANVTGGTLSGRDLPELLDNLRRLRENGTIP